MVLALPSFSPTHVSDNYGAVWASVFFFLIRPCPCCVCSTHMHRPRTGGLNHSDDMHLPLSPLPFISITESNITQWKSQAAKINLIFLISKTRHCTPGTHTMFQEGDTEISERKGNNLRMLLASVWICVCFSVYIFVGGHMWVLCRINNLDGLTSEEDPVQTWLKLLAAASERERSKHEKEMSVRMYWRERSHHAEGERTFCSALT